jgi:tRNA uridine 5-carboxymethylaminomethyl modification enzyme
VIDEAKNEIAGILTGSGEKITSKKVVITTGTFLRARCHIGKQSYPAGRHMRNSANVEPPSIALALTLERRKFPLSRLTTGTPPRLNGKTINYSLLTSEGSDDPVVPFHFVHEFEGFTPKHRLLDCHITHTNGRTHSIIDQNRMHLPTFQANEGKGVGPRYCPAIEKKVIRFPDKHQHQIWLEPEGN